MHLSCRTLVWMAMVLSCGFLSGCSSILQNLSQGYAAAPLELGLRDGKERESTKLLNSIRTNLKADVCFSDQYDPAKAQDCQGIRNIAVATLMIESNYLCVEHLKSIYGNEAVANITAGSVATFSSAMAAVTGGVQAAANLSALSTFSNAERALFNETIYKSLLTTAIGTKIRQMREEKGKALVNSASENYGKYRIEQALVDVLGFHESCSFFRGLEVALAEGTQVTPETKRTQLEAKIQAQVNLINGYIRTHSNSDPNTFWRKVDAAAIKDPSLRAYVEQLALLQRELVSLAPVVK